MDIASYIASQLPERQALLSRIHNCILEEDKTVQAVVEPMMGKPMIVYKDKGVMKYGLAGVKNHMSLHVLPIYAVQALYKKYQDQLPQAAFQKGCINFRNENELPLEVVRRLFQDTAAISMAKLREEYFQSRKTKRATT